MFCLSVPLGFVALRIGLLSTVDSLLVECSLRPAIPYLLFVQRMSALSGHLSFLLPFILCESVRSILSGSLIGFFHPLLGVSVGSTVIIPLPFGLDLPVHGFVRLVPFVREPDALVACLWH